MEPPATARIADHVRALLAFGPVEVYRRAVGPQVALRHLREIGRFWRRRSRTERLSLRSAIARVDKAIFRTPNCYRQVLLESALDSGASAEPVLMGLVPGGGTRSGHVWFESDTRSNEFDSRYSVKFKM